MTVRRAAEVLVLSLAMAAFLFACGGGGGGSSSPPPPTVSTSTTNSTGIDNAVINGSVNPNGQATTAWFEYGTDNTLAAFTKTADQSIGSAAVAVSVNQAISGLNAATTYYFRVAASNPAGTSKGAIQSIATLALAPAVSTTAATPGVTSAELGGTVNPNGLVTTAWFEYGLDNNTLSSKTADQDVGSGKTAATVSDITGTLTPDTTYYYRIVASNSTGESAGSVKSFTTAVNPPPSANAGPDQAAFMGHVVTLDGSASSDAANGGTITSYSWTQVGGQAVTLTGADTASPSFTAPDVAYPSEALTFQLTVTSSRGPTASDNVVVADKWGYSDDFSTDTTGNYTTTITTGTFGTFTWDAVGQRASVVTGNDNALMFSPTGLPVPGSATGVFSLSFLPTTKYPSGGGIWIQLKQNDTTYYEIVNYDWDTTGDPGYVAKFVGGSMVDNSAFTSNYTQGQTYPITVTFSPANITVVAFGETISLTTNTSSITVNSITVECGQQDAYFDNFILQAAP